jgi:hypothetical protein
MLRRLGLYAIVLLEEIPTLLRVTRCRVCELDGGHEWDAWSPDVNIIMLGHAAVMRECRNCGVTEHGVQASSSVEMSWN